MHDDPRALLKKHGKTFNFARLFLGKHTGMAAARLYRFCRIVDDIADDSDDQEHARIQLQALSQAIKDNQKQHPIVGDFLHLCEAFHIQRLDGVTLIEGVAQDLDFQAVQDEKALIEYAYKVAGVVGLMMAPILGADKQGFRFAVDLGIGMQLTNIARDVMEDAMMGRRYVPGEWLENISAEQITMVNTDDTNTVQHAIEKLLHLAELYYNSGLAGLYYLPRRNQKAIAVAAYVYRAIGRKLSQHNHQYWQGRTVVTGRQKVKLAAQALWHLNRGVLANQATKHNDELHQHLRPHQIQQSPNARLSIVK